MHEQKTSYNMDIIEQNSTYKVMQKVKLRQQKKTTQESCVQNKRKTLTQHTTLLFILPPHLIIPLRFAFFF